MDAYDRMVITTLVSYIFMIIGIAVAIAFVLRNACGFSHNDSRDYAIIGTLLLVTGLYFWILRRPNPNFKRLETKA